MLHLDHKSNELLMTSIAVMTVLESASNKDSFPHKTLNPDF